MAFACALFAAFDLNSQTLDLPPRPANAASGSEFANRISSMSLTDRENAIYAEIASGNVPNFLRNLVAITTNATISGIGHTITYYVTPDYLALGNDEDYFLQPMTPLLGQRLADLLHCSMPTRKMVNDIWTKASVKLAPAPIPPSAAMITVPVFIEHNLMVRTQRLQQIATYPLGALVSGDKKDVVISNEIYNRPPPPRVVIYGWHYQNGNPIQPLSAVHEETYADYSHGVRLVQMSLTVDGVANTVTNVLTNPNLARLLSDETTQTGNTISIPRYAVAATGPVILTHPFSQTVRAGATVHFAVVAIETPPVSYQWKFNGTNISGATNSMLLLTNVQLSHVGNYSATVTDSSGSTTTIPASLRLNDSDFPVLFQDDFDTNSSARWNLFWGAGNGIPDYTVNWSFDYGTTPYILNGKSYLIPPAPNSTNHTTRGVKFTVNNNDASGWIASVNIYPKNKTFSGNYVLKCDMWINYPGSAGGLGSGIAGSTEHAIFGINHFGTQANWAVTNASSSDGIWFAVDGEGGTSRDFRAYVGNPASNPTELTTLTSSGLTASNNTAGIFPALFPSTRFETAGAPGKNWVEVEVIQTNNRVIWKMDGAIIAQRTNSSSFKSGTFMLGLMDVFSSVATPASNSFVIFDNVRLENLSELRFNPMPVFATGQVQLELLGVSGETYSIEASTNLLNWNLLTILPGSNGPSIFVDEESGEFSQRFYRAVRN